jgi:hypothetical protein
MRRVALSLKGGDGEKTSPQINPTRYQTAEVFILGLI